MRTVVKGTRAQMIDANLPTKLWAESIDILVYIKNKSPTSAIYEGTMISIQDFHRGDLQTLIIYAYLAPKHTFSMSLAPSAG